MNSKSLLQNRILSKQTNKQTDGHQILILIKTKESKIMKNRNKKKEEVEEKLLPKV